MPLTPKQLVAALPVMLATTPLLIVMAPFPVSNLIIDNILSSE